MGSVVWRANRATIELCSNRRQINHLTWYVFYNNSILPAWKLNSLLLLVERSFRSWNLAAVFWGPLPGWYQDQKPRVRKGLNFKLWMAAMCALYASNTLWNKSEEIKLNILDWSLAVCFSQSLAQLSFSFKKWWNPVVKPSIFCFICTKPCFAWL